MDIPRQMKGKSEDQREKEPVPKRKEDVTQPQPIL
jgi:hypothetical protein